MTNNKKLEKKKHQRHCRADKGFVCSCLPDISEMTELFGLSKTKILAFIDYDKLTKEQKLESMAFYKVDSEKVKDFLTAIDEIHDDGEYLL